MRKWFGAAYWAMLWPGSVPAVPGYGLAQVPAAVTGPLVEIACTVRQPPAANPLHHCPGAPLPIRRSTKTVEPAKRESVIVETNVGRSLKSRHALVASVAQ